MRTIRIKNQVSNASLQGIYAFVAIFLVHAIIDIVYSAIYLNSGMTIPEYISFIGDNFLHGEVGIKIAILYLIFAPILWFGIMANSIYTRFTDTLLANLDPKTIKDFVFCKEGVSIRYKKAGIPQKNIMYQNIKQMRFTLSTFDNSRGEYISSERISLIDIEDNVYIINCFPVSIHKLYKLACYAKFMQGFEYNINGSSKSLRKRLEKNFKKIIENDYKLPPSLLIPELFLYLLYGIFALSVGFVFYMQIPAHTNDIDKEYTSYVETGYSYFQNGRYYDALKEYDKALNINSEDHVLYYYRALAYEYSKQYDKAIVEANKGIEYINSKSTFNDARNVKLVKNDIGLYTTLTDCYMETKRYDEALNAINYVIDHVKYKYTDAYFKRGMCKFYLGDKAGALADFFKHREIINMYLEDQANSEYKAAYPTYTNENLENINLWINACRN